MKRFILIYICLIFIICCSNYKKSKKELSVKIITNKAKYLYSDNQNFEIILTNNYDTTINILGTSRNYDYIYYPCLNIRIENSKGNYHILSKEPRQNFKKNIIKLKPKEKYTLNLKKELSKDSLSRLLPDTYYVTACYFIRDSEIEKYIKEKDVNIWKGITVSDTISFIITPDNSDELKIRKQVISGENLKQIELSITYEHENEMLFLNVLNKGEDLYLGNNYCIVKTIGDKESEQFSGIRSGSPHKIKANDKLQLGGWQIKDRQGKKYSVRYYYANQKKYIESNKIGF